MKNKKELVTLVIFFVLLLSFFVGEGVKAVKLRITVDKANALIGTEDSRGVRISGPLEAKKYFSFGEEALEKNQTGMAVVCFRAACALDPELSRSVVNIYERYARLYDEKGGGPYTEYFSKLAEEFERGG